MTQYNKTNNDDKMYIKHLKDELGWDEQHFINFLKKYYKKMSIEVLTRKEASKVIESLKGILRTRKM